MSAHSELWQKKEKLCFDPKNKMREKIANSTKYPL